MKQKVQIRPAFLCGIHRNRIFTARTTCVSKISQYVRIAQAFAAAAHPKAHPAKPGTENAAFSHHSHSKRWLLSEKAVKNGNGSAQTRTPVFIKTSASLLFLDQRRKPRAFLGQRLILFTGQRVVQILIGEESKTVNAVVAEQALQ